MQPPAAPENTPAPSDDGGFDVYQDTMHIDPAVMAEAISGGKDVAGERLGWKRTAHQVDCDV